MSGAPTREVAHRVFAEEFNDASYTFKESDDERAPVYILLPTGAGANRVFFVGTLTETEDVGSDSEYWQGRIVDPTGTFYAYAGQYQPEAASALRELDTPTYVSVVGKPRTFETDDGSTNVAIRPESITAVGEGTRDRWVAEAADKTLDRIENFDGEVNSYANMAKEEYDLPIERYQQEAIGALESLDEAEENGPQGNDSSMSKPEASQEETTEDDSQ